MPFLSILLQSLGTVLTLVITQLLWTYFRSPIKNIPGPFLAKFTNLWRLFDTYGGRAELTHQTVHEKYGFAVRLGPNIVSLNDPKLLKIIYNTRGDYLKSEFYSVNDSKLGSQIIHNVFSTRSNELHSAAMRPLLGFYKMSSILAQEPLVDKTIAALCTRLDEEFVEKGRPCRMDEWMLFFAWDVISQLTFGRPMGFLDQGKDHTGILSTSKQAMDYFAVVGQIPALDHWLAKNPVRPVGPPGFGPAVAYCAQQVMGRQKTDAETARQPDMLDGFLEIKKSNPKTSDDKTIISALLVNILAGADTTAALLCSIIYFTLKHPKIHRKLLNELDNANLSKPITYATTSTLPYLDAIIKESSRIHPVIGLLLERIVPEGGLKLSDGTIIPPGTIVGMNPWVLHQDKQIYGEDAASFNPNRWLRDFASGETEEDFQARLALMKATDLSFGAGNRACFGKNISFLEIYKVVATLFLEYDVSLFDIILRGELLMKDLDEARGSTKEMESAELVVGATIWN
ncbi:Cytochrome P450 monooxygenase andK [Lachnellula suecica]|uniref:Cytochrome P450 monooxygenase andK n=1 Tax=Lachnellula suecica TaxID=602035 RepID=A0A8T9BXY9_9HELO|nr:Cytochrome P450 monooxygenase andK [Lachnellula suecica]